MSVYIILFVSWCALFIYVFGTFYHSVCMDECNTTSMLCVM